ncbi:MAG: polysaccharide deacetylase family protein [Halanaerobiales bacterium]|nr:polysaccharide deacetylase family protein [Halanaerobiales bacterium]
MADEEPKAYQKPLVMLHFDDSYIGVYENAFPLMEEHGYQGTIYVPTNFIDRPDHTLLTQLIEMEEAGWVIGSHTRTHPDLMELDDAALYDEIVGSRNLLISRKLINIDTAHFCSPMTVWNPMVETFVKTHYISGRGKELVIFATEKQPKQHVRVVLKTTSLNAIKQWIWDAHQDNAWLILIFHEVADDGNEYFFPPDRFAKTLDLFEKFGSRIVTVQEAVEEWIDDNKNK